MFDLSSFELQKSIMNYNRKQMLESQQVETQAKKKLLENSIDALVHEYDRTYNTESSKVIERRFIREAAVISVVKDAMYGIFEASLMIEDSVKAEYQDNIKSLFESYFYEILKENNVKTLGQFKEFIKGSNVIIENVVERAEKLVAMNENVYTELLNTTYNGTSLDNVIVEAMQFASSPDNAEEEKVNKAREVVDQLSAEFQRFTLEQKVASAHKIIQAAILILRLGVAIDKAAYTVVDKLLSVVNSVFGRDSDSTLRQKLLRKTLKEVDSYYYTAIDVAITLKKLQKSYPENSPEYLKVGERIVSIYKAIVIINQYRQSLIDKCEIKPMNEMSYVEFITEADSASINTINQDDVIKGLKEKVNASMVDFDAYQGLENVKLANRITSDPNYHKSFIDHGNNGANTTLLFIKALKNPNLSDKLRDQYTNEAKSYVSNLNSVVETGRRRGANVYEMVKQGKRLDSFLSQSAINGAPTKMIRESISPLLSIDHKVGMDMIASTIIECAQFFELYEASSTDIEYVIGLVNESDEFNPDINADLSTLARTMRENVTENSSLEAQEQSLALEAAIYKKLYMASAVGISESANEELKKGKYPKLNDFLDEDDKKLIDSIVSITGKNQVIDTVKAKIVGVLEGEEKRMQKLEDEEEKLLAKLSKTIPEGGENIQEAVQNRLGRSNRPETLFEAIAHSRHQKHIQEAVALGTGFDINMQKNTIMSESIALYTIHETFNTLKFGPYHKDASKYNKLIVDYSDNKI